MTLETPVWIQSGSFPSRMDRLLVDTVMAAGVLDGRADPVTVLPASTALKATPNNASLAVDVAAGVAVIAGTDQTNQGKYVCRSTAVQTVTINPRPAAGQSRLDLIYAQVVDTSAGISGTDGWTIAVATGVPSGSAPQLPAVPASALALAQVSVVSGAATTFAPGDVTDLRVRALSRVGAIPKQLHTATGIGTGASEYFDANGRNVAGAEINPLVTYTPNVAVVCTMTVDVTAAAAGACFCAVQFINLIGVGPSHEWLSTEKLILQPTTTQSMQGTLVTTHVIAAPGSYYLRLSGAVNPGNPNANVNTSGRTLVSAAWWDIAGPTG